MRSGRFNSEFAILNFADRMCLVLLRLGTFEITSFGLMVALGAGLGLLLLRREMIRARLNEAAGTDAALVVVLGGLAGAKLLFVIEHLHEGLAASLLSRGG